MGDVEKQLTVKTNEYIDQLFAKDEQKRKFEVSLNDYQEKMQQYQSNNLKFEETIKALEFKISQINNENNKEIKKRDSAIEDIEKQLAVKTNEYNDADEKLIEVTSTAEIYRQKNAKLKMEHKNEVEKFKTDIQKLERYAKQIENEKFEVENYLATKLARTGDSDAKAQKLTEDNLKNKKQ